MSVATSNRPTERSAPGASSPSLGAPMTRGFDHGAEMFARVGIQSGGQVHGQHRHAGSIHPGDKVAPRFIQRPVQPNAKKPVHNQRWLLAQGAFNVARSSAGDSTFSKSTRRSRMCSQAARASSPLWPCEQQNSLTGRRQLQRPPRHGLPDKIDDFGLFARWRFPKPASGRPRSPVLAWAESKQGGPRN